MCWWWWAGRPELDTLSSEYYTRTHVYVTIEQSSQYCFRHIAKVLGIAMALWEVHLEIRNQCALGNSVGTR